MTREYRSLDAEVSATVEVKRSVFRCLIAPAADERQTRAVVERVRKDAWDARHHCSAFILAPDASVQRSNDDGEPSGTAGVPILEALRGADLTHVVAVVSRWFGGTLLGTGGLVRAYGDATRAALEEAVIVRYERRTVLACDVPLAEVGRVENAVRASGAFVQNVDYSRGGDVAGLDVTVRPDDVAQAQSLLAELTAGQSEFTSIGECWSKG